jgi:hypothetical protein
MTSGDKALERVKGNPWPSRAERAPTRKTHWAGRNDQRERTCARPRALGAWLSVISRRRAHGERRPPCARAELRAATAPRPPGADPPLQGTRRRQGRCPGYRSLASALGHHSVPGRRLSRSGAGPSGPRRAGHARTRPAPEVSPNARTVPAARRPKRCTVVVARQEPRRAGPAMLAGGGTPDPGNATFAVPGEESTMARVTSFFVISFSFTVPDLARSPGGSRAGPVVARLVAQRDASTDGTPT